MMGYLFNILLGAAVYAVGATQILRGTSKPLNRINRVFLASISLCYLANILFSISPLDGLNLPNCTPISNVSPFLFTLSALALVLPDKWKKRLYCLFSLFVFPMFLAAFATNLFALPYSQIYWLFSPADTLAHILFSLFGLYLLRTRQVQMNRRIFLCSCAAVYGVALLALAVNLVWNTCFFGLNFYGRHQIYGLVLTESGTLSALIYFACLTAVLLFGYAFDSRLLQKKNQ